MKKIFVVSLAGLSLFCACKKEDKNSGRMPEQEVSVALVQQDSVMIYKDYPGTLKAKDMAQIVARVNGTLQSINYNAGDVVPKGALLFIIDETQYRNSVQQAQGQLENAISSTEYYKKQYAAMQKAFQSDAVSEMEVLQAKSNMEEGQAQIKAYSAALQTAKTNLGYCRITAPFAGRVSASTLSVGNYLDGAASPVTLATLYNDREFYADFYIEDAAYIHLKGPDGEGIASAMDSIQLTFSEPLKYQYFGAMEYMAPDIDRSTGTMMLRVKLANSHDELRDGMYATISLPYRNDPKALLVEDAAIGTDQRGRYIYVVDKNGVVKYTPVTVGSLVGTRRVVTGDINPGDWYVDKAFLKVRNGLKVKPILEK